MSFADFRLGLLDTRCSNRILKFSGGPSHVFPPLQEVSETDSDKDLLNSDDNSGKDQRVHLKASGDDMEEQQHEMNVDEDRRDRKTQEVLERSAGISLPPHVPRESSPQESKSQTERASTGMNSSIPQRIKVPSGGFLSSLWYSLFQDVPRFQRSPYRLDEYHNVIKIEDKPDLRKGRTSSVLSTPKTQPDNSGGLSSYLWSTKKSTIPVLKASGSSRDKSPYRARSLKKIDRYKLESKGSWSSNHSLSGKTDLIEEENEEEIEKVRKEEEEERKKEEIKKKLEEEKSAKMREEMRIREEERKERENRRSKFLRAPIERMKVRKFDDDSREEDSSLITEDSNEELLWATLLAEMQEEDAETKVKTLNAPSPPPPSPSCPPSVSLATKHHHRHHRHRQQQRMKNCPKIPEEDFQKKDESRKDLATEVRRRLKFHSEKREVKRNEVVKLQMKDMSTEIKEDFVVRKTEEKRKLTALETEPEFRIDLLPDSNPISMTDYFSTIPSNITSQQHKIRVTSAVYSTDLW